MWQGEQARKRSRTGEDYFLMKLPVFCIENFKKAPGMAKTANGMVTLPMEEQVGMMGMATEQALKHYTQALNKELYKLKEESIKEAAEAETEIPAKEEAKAEEASAESMHGQ